MSFTCYLGMRHLPMPPWSSDYDQRVIDTPSHADPGQTAYRSNPDTELHLKSDKIWGEKNKNKGIKYHLFFQHETIEKWFYLMNGID